MEVLSVKGKIPFTECLRTILFQTHGDEEAETYAFYQHACSYIFRVRAEVVNHNQHYYRLHEAILKFEAVYHKHEDIDFFEIVHKKAGDDIKVLLRPHFREWSQEIYENEGRRLNTRKGPIAVAYVSRNFLEYLDGDTGYTLFRKDFIPNPFAHQLDGIHQFMKKKDYQLTAETTVKEFYRDIIKDVYPQASVHEQNLFCRFFKKHHPPADG